MKMFVVFVTLLYVSQHASALETQEGVESVLLHCDFPTFDLDEPSVVWSRSDLRPSTVHQRQMDKDDLKDQNQDYRGRTSMRTEALRTGDLSLTLRRPTTRDSGSYSCILRGTGQEERQSQVTMEVKELPVNLGYILIGVTGLLLSLAAAALLVYKMYQCKRKEGGTGCLLFWGIVPLVLLVSAAAVSSFILHKGIKDQVEPPPYGIAGLLGLLLLLALLIPLWHGCFVCLTLCEEIGQRYLREILLFLLYSALVVLCGVMFLKGINTNTEVSRQGNPVEAYRGELVLLPCKNYWVSIDPTATWIRRDLRPPTVHQRHELGDDLRDQNQIYSNRTSMKTGYMTTGDLSLNLSDVRPSDSGSYTCIVCCWFGNEKTLTTIQLKVKENYSVRAEVFAFFGLLVLLSVTSGVTVIVREGCS